MNTKYAAEYEPAELVIPSTAEERVLFYKRYACVLYGIICTIVTEDVYAEKALEKTFDYIFTNLENYRPDCGSFLTWAMQVARTTSIGYLSGAKQVQKPGYLVKTESDNVLPGGSLQPRTYAELTDHDVLVMVLQGCQAHEVATQMNMPVEVVKNKIRRAMLLKANRV